MIHCSLAHSGSWGRMARHLSGLLTMTAFDLPGHGRSAVWDGRGEIQKVTADIAETFLSAPTDVIGHSFGATVALRLAVMRPELVRSLTLIEPVFFAAAFQDRPDLAPKLQASHGDYTPAMQRGDTMVAARDFTRLWGDGTDWKLIPQTQKQQLADQMYLIEAAHDALHNDAGGILAPGVLGALDMPILLMEGSESPEVISAINDSLCARLTNVTRAVIMGAAHMAPITHAGQISAEILRFLDEYPPLQAADRLC